MKTMKYRSVVSALGLAILSVFLFTSCEKESEGIPKKVDRISKFKSLTFTGESASTTTTASTGSFTGNNNNITFVPPENNESPSFASSLEEGQAFTDPRSVGDNFSIASYFSFGMGGGTVTFDRKSYDLAMGFCLSSDLFGFTDDFGNNGGSAVDNLDLFVGIAGDFNLDGGSFESSSGLFLYVFSYNGGSDIGSFDAFNNTGNVDNKAFVIAVRFDGGANAAGVYFGTSGTANFSGSNVVLNNVKMAGIEENSTGDYWLSSRKVDLSAFLECGNFELDL